MTKTAWRLVLLVLALSVTLFLMVAVTGHAGSLSPVPWGIGLVLVVAWWALLIGGAIYVWRRRAHDRA